MTSPATSVLSQFSHSRVDSSISVENKKQTSVHYQNKVDSAAKPTFIDSAQRNVFSATLLVNTAPDIFSGNVSADKEALSNQLSQLLSIFTNSADLKNFLTTEQRDEVDKIVEKAGFDIRNIQGGFSGRAIAILQVIVSVTLLNKENMRQQASLNNEISRKLSDASAEKLVQAGIANRNMETVKASISMFASVASCAVQTKAYVKSNQAVKLHGNNQITHTRTADELKTMSSPGRGSKRTSESPVNNDCKRLKVAENRANNNAMNESFQLHMRENDANKLQVQGTLIGQGGQQIASLSSSQGHVDTATANADSQRLKADESIYASRKEADEREKDTIAQLKAEFLQLINALLSNRANAVSSMTNNLKG